jgi:hypothetical protein
LGQILSEAEASEVDVGSVVGEGSEGEGSGTATPIVTPWVGLGPPLPAPLSPVPELDIRPGVADPLAPFVEVGPPPVPVVAVGPVAPDPAPPVGVLVVHPSSSSAAPAAAAPHAPGVLDPLKGGTWGVFRLTPKQAGDTGGPFGGYQDWGLQTNITLYLMKKVGM